MIGAIEADRHAHGRIMHLRFEGLVRPGQLADLLTSLGTLASGALGLKLVEGWLARRQQKRATAGQLTVEILEDGADLRHRLLEEAKELRALERAATDRAHAAELRAASLETEVAALKTVAAQREQLLARLLDEFGGSASAARSVSHPQWPSRLPA
jgi:hypothetical protein